MNADEFVSRMQKCAPDVDKVVQAGLPLLAAKSLVRKYRAELRDNAERNVNPLLDLVTRFAANNLEIGMVRFAPSSMDLGRLWQVGEAEADPLVINKTTLGVEVRDVSDEEFLIWTCASNAEYFLDALHEAACFFASEAVNPEHRQDNVVLFDMAQRCASLAGSDEYSNFYEMLFGCDVE